ncbi:hypothetical protein D3C71_1659170 [compost metagenome]
MVNKFEVMMVISKSKACMFYLLSYYIEFVCHQLEIINRPLFWRDPWPSDIFHIQVKGSLYTPIHKSHQFILWLC